MVFAALERRHRRILVAPALLAVAGLVGACQSSSSSSGVEDLLPVADTSKSYNEGLAALRDGDAKEAAKKFKEVDGAGRSDMGQRALIMSSYAYFKRGDFQEAINDARRYVTLYPNSEDAAYAQYLIGESMFRQIPDVTRDQEVSRRAVEEMQKVVDQYPTSEYADDARRKVEIAQDQLAGKQMQIGRYYLERREYLAAVNRFKVVVSKHQTTRHVEEALHRLTEAYLALGILPEAQNAAAVLGHNFPSSPWYQESFRLLAKGGVAPKESQRSWLSRAFAKRAA